MEEIRNLVSRLFKHSVKGLTSAQTGRTNALLANIHDNLVQDSEQASCRQQDERTKRGLLAPAALARHRLTALPYCRFSAQKP